MSDEFIIEEETEGGPDRTFLILAGILTAVLLLAAICTLTVLLRGRSTADRAEEIAAIETQNAVVAVTNAAVTQTIAAVETEEARPTATPTATPTPLPTDTPQPTNTPVISQAEEETETPTQTPNATLTALALSGEQDNTPTPIAAAGADGGALPQTGLDTWSALIAAFLLVGMLVAARRLRTS